MRTRRRRGRRTTINSTNHNHRGTNESKSQTTKTNSNNAEQEVGTVKSGILPTTNDQCLDKALRTINEGVSGSYVRKPEKTVPFWAIDLSIPTSQQGTNTTNRERTNRRCTRNNTHCATSLIRRISTGNTRLVPALEEIMEAAMDAINTLTV